MEQPRDSSDPLAPWLAAARADLARQAPPEWIESTLAAHQAERALLLRLRSDKKAPPARRKTTSRLWWWCVPAAMAALLLVGVGVIFLAGPPVPPYSNGAPFVALTPLETIASEPRPMVFASEVPRAQLAAMGVPVDPARADLPVRAEFLVSQRGALLAVRFSPE